MARPPNELPPDILAEIRTRKAQGESSKTIASDLKARGVEGVSERSVSRWAKSKATPAPTMPQYPPGPSDEDDPEGAPEEDPLFGTYDGVLRDAERLERLARGVGNLGLVARCGTLKISALEAKRKATPPEAPDLNEAPDMLAAAKRAREALHRLIDSSPEDA